MLIDLLRSRLRVWLAPLLFLGLWGGPPAASADWKAGAASVDITPDYPVRLSGYGSRTAENEGVAMRLHAKALALTWNEEPPNIIVTVDNCGVPASIRTAVLAKLRESGHAIEDERFAVHSSHTHCAPMLPGVLPFLFGQELSAAEAEHVKRYGADLTERMTEAVQTALRNQQPATVDWGRGKVRFAMNRRLQTPNGLQNAPNPYGPVDHDLPVLRVRSKESKLIAVFTSYACHCTTLAINQIHPDWAGCAQAELELRFPGAVALTALGCGGDQNPYPRRELRHAQEHGIILAKEVVRVINEPLRPIAGPIVSAAKEVRLPFEGLPERAVLQQRAEDPKAKALGMHARHYLAMLDSHEEVPTDLPYLLQVWTFGNDLLLINLPGEVVVDYSLRFKRSFIPDHTWVNGYSNDVPCYIPSQRVWEEGGYEGAGAMVYYGRPSRFASGIETIIAEGVKGLVPESFKTQQAKR